MTKVRLDELKQALEQKRPPAAKSEAQYKRELVAEINLLPGGRARRIEDRFAIGVLDMIIKLPGAEIVLAEGKLIDGYLFGPTAAQYEEGKKWSEANVDCILLGWKNGQLFIAPWVKMADCRQCFTRPELADAEALMEFLQ